ncbi:MAG: class II aldolase/adducin family protein [Desulfobacteraceae bacterium]|nr:class II aldolase/adducin family protein [Desulfobacteraceae bacterium]
MEEEKSGLTHILLTACRILDRENILDELGHVSARLPGSDDKILMNGKTSPGCAGESDLVVIDMQGRKIQGENEPVNETPLHLSIYRSRPEIGAIVHSHSPAILGLSVSGHTLRALDNLGAMVFGGQAPFFEEYGLVDNYDMGHRIVEKMNGENIIVLKGHGNIVAGRSIEECCVHAIWAEKAAKLQYQALTIGQPCWMLGRDVAKVRRQVNEGKAFIRSWNYYKKGLEDSPGLRDRQ